MLNNYTNLHCSCNPVRVAGLSKGQHRDTNNRPHSIQSCQLTYRACLWTVERSRSTRREPMKVQGEHVNSTQKGLDLLAPVLTTCTTVLSQHWYMKERMSPKEDDSAANLFLFTKFQYFFIALIAKHLSAVCTSTLVTNQNDASATWKSKKESSIISGAQLFLIALVS